MAQCPICQAQVPDDFGLIECRSCGASFFLELEGQPSAVSAPASAPEIEAPIDSFDFSDPIENVKEQSVVTASQKTEDFDEPVPDFEELSEASRNMPKTAITPMPEISGEEHFQQIQNFANSEVSQGKEGLLKVNLKISGIDTADLRTMVYEALLDKKFLWDAEAIMKSLESGELLINDISSVKASVLLSRLRSIPVQVSWEQHAIHQL